jgi:hypothetical protein
MGASKNLSKPLSRNLIKRLKRFKNDKKNITKYDQRKRAFEIYNPKI